VNTVAQEIRFRTAAVRGQFPQTFHPDEHFILRMVRQLFEPIDEGH
jgi:hypothetical protein